MKSNLPFTIENQVRKASLTRDFLIITIFTSSVT